MGSSLLIDNWLLQDVGNCLTWGLNDEDYSEIVIDQPRGTHSIRNVSSAGVQLEGLLGLLVDIVFRDSIIVDSDFTDTWEQYQEIFAVLLQSGLVRALPFRAHDSSLIEARKFVVDRLCVTSTLREAQKRNEESWAAKEESDNSYMSAVIWGAAGMLGRSHVFEAPYSGHPLRKRVVEQTVLASPARDMVADTMEFLAEERLRFFGSESKNGSQKTAIITLPPVVVEIIDEAQDIHDLIPIAYQLREKYAKMREWMKSVQTAVELDDLAGIKEYKKTLHAVAKDLNRTMGDNDTGSITLNISFFEPSVSIAIGTLGDVMKKFGMRATLNNQIFSPQGEKSVKKLLRMFEVDGTSVGLAAQEYLRN